MVGVIKANPAVLFLGYASLVERASLHTPTMADRKRETERIRATAEGFCAAFVAGEPPSEILDKYFTSTAKILEHGPFWAVDKLPFLAQTFQGRSSGGESNDSHKLTCDRYYELLTSVLALQAEDAKVLDIMVDPGKGSATVKLHGKFSSVKTGKSWHEDFVYILSDFDNDGKIGSQELWADPLSAWAAVQGT